MIQLVVCCPLLLQCVGDNYQRCEANLNMKRSMSTNVYPHNMLRLSSLKLYSAYIYVYDIPL